MVIKIVYNQHIEIVHNQCIYADNKCISSLVHRHPFSRLFVMYYVVKV